MRRKRVSYTDLSSKNCWLRAISRFIWSWPAPFGKGHYPSCGAASNGAAGLAAALRQW